MLIRFTVENFLSFKDEVEFSMVAGPARKHPDHIVKVRDMRLLKTSVIYGANASGKTNLIKAMSFAHDFVTTGSLSALQPYPIPFLLENSTIGAPSKFCFEFQCGIGQRFEYEFVVDVECVHEECLSEILPESKRLIFKRVTNPNGQTNIEFGALTALVTNTEERFDFLPKSGNPKELFLTQYRRLEEMIKEPRIAYLAIVYDWFATALAPIFTDSVPADGIGLGFMRLSDFEDRYLEILKKLDLGIDGIGLTETPGFDAKEDLSDVFKEFIQLNAEKLPQNSNQRAIFYDRVNDIYVLVDNQNRHTAYSVVAKHMMNDENLLIEFDLDMESDGTRRLLTVIPDLFGLFRDEFDRVFVLDELDRSLHTQLSYKLMELFLENSGNRRSQLIVTTHDTSLLDLDLLRRDEIWFVEKDRHGASSLYSLEEFDLPKGMNIEKGYLGGRLGAIPILANDDTLEWTE